ncbi:hypothetical protein AB0F43_11010 [Kribbella sp. NPDC023972]|uniref:hypothetical protein n=1 Tax=Kribbella sp. NPDC023972 TaxID=3154795 RepID=UPI0033D15009
MTSASSGGDAFDLLKRFHERLDVHFRELSEQRHQLSPVAPVFALEHDLPQAEFEVLEAAVRAAVASGFGPRYRQWWLPFVVYAANVGYDYVGVDYWPIFAQRTPGWDRLSNINGHRSRLRDWFVRFADEYGGARPTGAFADFFVNIAWPIAHAVLPVYLQRQLARLLFEFRSITADQLADPDALGAALAARTRGYPERFQEFCTMHSLLGRVALALLQGENEDSPYLVRSTLERIVGGLTSERQAKVWLSKARHRASQVRTTGFRGKGGALTSTSTGTRTRTLSDPRLSMKRLADGWRLFADIPDLTPLATRLPQLYDELKQRRARIAGVPRPVAPGRLLYAGEQLLTALPAEGQAFIQLERADPSVNVLVANQCMLTPGPWWVFRRRTANHAVQVKGAVVRPGQRYLLVARPETPPPAVAWLSEVELRLEGARGYLLDLPEQIGDLDAFAFTTAGISVISSIAIRPVGLTPASWDGEGLGEFLEGDPILLGLRAEHPPEACVITINGGAPELLPWPAETPELFFGLTDLVAGVYEITVTLLGTGEDSTVASGALTLVVREPREEAENAGTGIRMLASPARPLLTDLWDGRASLSIEGPSGLQAQLTVTLRGPGGESLAHLQRPVRLPLTDQQWRTFAVRELRGSELAAAYDDAETAEIAVSRGGVGFATLQCERGFRPLRWVISKVHDGGYEAHLIDRTDAQATTVTLFETSEPLVGHAQVPDQPIASPLNGGLLVATSGDVSSAIVIPPDPNRLFAQGGARRPFVQIGPRSLIEAMRLIRGHALWADAELPADPFAQAQRERALQAITSELAGLIGGSRWAHQERGQREKDILDHLEEMQAIVGTGAEQQIGDQIAARLWHWANAPDARVPELAGLLDSVLNASGMGHPVTAVRFLERLASRPGRLLRWEETKRRQLLEGTLRSPVLLRAVRFAVLGSDALRPEPRDSTNERGPS